MLELAKKKVGMNAERFMTKDFGEGWNVPKLSSRV
jgi:hypothetical protein